MRFWNVFSPILNQGGTKLEFPPTNPMEVSFHTSLIQMNTSKDMKQYGQFIDNNVIQKITLRWGAGCCFYSQR
jgi:hypothetical protein